MNPSEKYSCALKEYDLGKIKIILDEAKVSDSFEYDFGHFGVFASSKLIESCVKAESLEVSINILNLGLGNWEPHILFRDLVNEYCSRLWVA